MLPFIARFRGHPSSSVINNQSNISTRSARVRVRLLTHWLALCAHDTWRRWGGGSGACFTGITLLGSRQVQVADALARAARSRPRAKMRGGNGRWLALHACGTGQTRWHWDVVEAGRWRVRSRCALASQGEGGGGQRRSLSLAHVTGGAGQKLGGGSGACFAYVSWLALMGDGGVLGVEHWRGMSGHQRWRVGGAMALSQCWRQHADVGGDGT
jgi:hypothetical protein